MPEENYCPEIQEVCWWKEVIFSCGHLHKDISAYYPPPSLFYRPWSPDTDLTRVTSGEVQHVEEEAQLTCQAELLLAKVVLD